MKKQISITLEEDLFTRLKEEAQRVNRTVSNLIEVAVAEYLDSGEE